jgi:hypothetical protein
MRDLISKEQVAKLQDMANTLRIHSITSTNASKSG